MVTITYHRGVVLFSSNKTRAKDTTGEASIKIRKFNKCTLITCNNKINSIEVGTITIEVEANSVEGNVERCIIEEDGKISNKDTTQTLTSRWVILIKAICKINHLQIKTNCHYCKSININKWAWICKMTTSKPLEGQYQMSIMIWGREKIFETKSFSTHSELFEDRKSIINLISEIDTKEIWRKLHSNMQTSKCSNNLSQMQYSYHLLINKTIRHNNSHLAIQWPL